MDGTKVIYDQDADKGMSLKIVDPNYGWVEHAKNHTRIFASKSFPLELYREYENNRLDWIKREWPGVPEEFGFVNHLISVLKDQNFIFPAFGFIDSNGRFDLSCGNSRFTAHRCVGGDINTLGLVIFSKQDCKYGNFTEITSTHQFNQFYDLNEVEHLIQMQQSGSDIHVKNSALKHTLYEMMPTENWMVSNLQLNTQKFWNRFANRNPAKVPTKVYCKPEHRSFIKQTPIFDIEFIDQNPAEWHFSFGRLLSAFKPKDAASIPEELHVWLFDVTEPFHLEWFMPHMVMGNSCVYTQNKKIVMFDPSFYCEFKIIGNIVK